MEKLLLKGVAMDQERVKRVLKSMEEQDLTQIIISDATTIFYLTGKWIHAGERLLVLLLNLNGNHKLVINELFPQEQDLGVDIVWYNDVQDGVEVLCQCLDKQKPVGIDKVWPASFLLKLMDLGGGSKFVNGSFIVDKVRMIKDDIEKDFMRDVSKHNDQVMEKLIPWVIKGKTEIELADKVKELQKAVGCDDISFSPITAYGKGAADPHHTPDESKGSTGDCVVLDIGGIKNDYVSDMTRTVFIGSVSDRAREIYEIVLEANLRGIAAAKPGNKMSDVDRAARSYIEEKGYGEFFTHRTGHSIGLECHEYGDVSLANDDIIKPGQCFSVEPGIYLLEEGIGIRIEDLVLITEDGCEVLNQFTKELIIVPEE